MCDRSKAALSSRGLSHMAPVLPSVATLAPIVVPFRPKLLEAFGKRTLERLALPPPILKLIGQSYLPSKWPIAGRNASVAASLAAAASLVGAIHHGTLIAFECLYCFCSCMQVCTVFVHVCRCVHIWFMYAGVVWSSLVLKYYGSQVLRFIIIPVSKATGIQ